MMSLGVCLSDLILEKNQEEAESWNLDPQSLHLLDQACPAGLSRSCYLGIDGKRYLVTSASIGLR